GAARRADDEALRARRALALDVVLQQDAGPAGPGDDRRTLHGGHGHVAEHALRAARAMTPRARPAGRALFNARAPRAGAAGARPGGRARPRSPRPGPGPAGGPLRGRPAARRRPATRW